MIKEDLLKKMTIDEKIGQLVQVTPNFFDEKDGEITGPLQELGLTTKSLYRIGSILGTHTKEQVIKIQQDYLEKSRLKIPLLFMADVIHGYETIFPVPIALGATWNPKTVTEVAKYSAHEASDAGVHVTFSPMVDLVRDSRWGRVMESTGEDPFLNSLYAEAFVKGYQGIESKLDTDFTKIAACAKHFIGYGAAEGGRDYNTVDISTISLYQYYLPSFKAAIDAGVKLVMTSFNTIHGKPATGNKWLMKEVLREYLGFDQVLISDWGAIWEMIPHGVAKDLKDASKLAMMSTVDIDMMTSAYQDSLKNLVEEDIISMEELDQAVLRVLTLKEDLGLFKDPYRGIKESDREIVDLKTIRKLSRTVASESMVLLKNIDAILPLKQEAKLGFVGPFVNSKDILGAWSWIGEQEKAISVEEALKKLSQNYEYCGTKNRIFYDKTELEQIKEIAKKVETLVVFLGEDSEETGEAASKTSLSLPEEQLSLLEELYSINQNIVVVLFNGRPLELMEVNKYSKGILEAWFPGSEGGNALIDVLFGQVTPSGKLPMTFPEKVGQVPIYYNQLRTGRPLTNNNKDQKYVSKYMDSNNTGLYPFGFGLSYTSFEYEISQVGEIVTDKKQEMFTVNICNTGLMKGKETIQCYYKASVGEVALPERQLLKFNQVELEPGETKEIAFTIERKELGYIHSDLSYQTDSGEFEIFIGIDSEAPYCGKVITKK